MRLHKFNVGAISYTFVCESAYTRHGFKHTCALFEGCSQISECTRYYLDYTRESFCYQSAMLGAIDRAMDLEAVSRQDILKLENGWDRMTENRNKALQERLQSSETWVALSDLRKAVKEYRD